MAAVSKVRSITSNPGVIRNQSIELMDARSHPAADTRCRRSDGLCHRGRQGLALLATLAQPPPRPARGGDRCSAAATGRPGDPSHARRGAARQPRRGDPGTRRRSCRRALGACRPQHGHGSPVRLHLRAEHPRSRRHRHPRREHPGLQLTLTDTHPPEALQLLRAGRVDVALIFRYDESPPEDGDIRLVHLLDDPTYLLTTGKAAALTEYRDSSWIAGCERCRAHLVDQCERAGFTPRIAYTTDDMVLMQSLVAAGLGVTMIPGLALRSHRAPGVTATEIPSSTRRVYAATYGAPPDPPATQALIDALRESQSSVAVPPETVPRFLAGDRRRPAASSSTVDMTRS